MRRLNTNRETPPHTRDRRRPGVVLLVVLVVVVLLSLGAYSFSEFMLLESQATAMYSRGVQTRMSADSGVELVAALLGDKATHAPYTLYHNPAVFQGMLMQESVRAGGRARFSVVAPVENDPAAQLVRFGVIDESAKLNLNMMQQLELDEDQSRQLMSGIPQITPEITDAILDWVDDDDDLRDLGAEDEYYLTLDPPYNAKNGPLESLDELLLVRGITPALLLGEDANRNGLLDPHENDGAVNPPADNADGILDRGWAAYFTVHSREVNLQPDRTPRIDLNKNALSELYDELETEFGMEVAQFVCAYRINGPKLSEEEVPPVNNNTLQPGANGLTRGETRQLEGVAQQLGAAMFGQGGSVTRGGMDLSKGGNNKVKSIYDLIGSEVEATVDGTSQLLTSPWSADPGDIPNYLPELTDKLSTTADRYIDGRININQAHLEVLTGLPGMTPEAAAAIAAAQMTSSSGESQSGGNTARATTGWLLSDGIVDIIVMRQLAPYVTAGGDVYRAQVVGYFDRGGPVTRIEAMVDATQAPPQVIYFRDLTDLGRGYPVSLLSAGVSGN